MYSAYNSIIKLIHLALLINIYTFSQSGNNDVSWPDPVFEHLTLADGLPENSVLCILQDRFGYLWLGTQFGLVRYDGYNIKDYQPEHFDTLGITWGSTITTMYEDKSGTLWIGTLKGLNRFDRVTEKKIRFSHNPNDTSSIDPGSINCIIEDKNGNILVGSNNGLYLFNQQNESFTNIDYKGSGYSEEVSAFIEDRFSGNMYVGTNNKILIFDADKQVLKDENRINNLIQNIGSINSLYQADNGLMWIGHAMGLSKLDLQSNNINHFQVITSSSYIDNNYIHQLIEDDNGFIWLISGPEESGSLMTFDSRSEKFKQFEHHLDKPSSISSTDRILSVYKDKTGIIWVGTLWAGLNKWDRNKNKFKRFSKDPDNSVDGDFKQVWSIIEDSKGTIWFGNKNGLNSFNRKSGKFLNYKYDLAGLDNNVTFIYKDESDIFWLGTETRGLVRFDSARNKYRFYSNDPKDSTSIGHNTIRYIFPDRNDILWVGTRGGGLNKFDKKIGVFLRYTPDFNNPHSLSNGLVERIIRDQKGTLWVGTQGKTGLHRFDQVSNTFMSFGLLGGGPVVLTIYEDHKGNFWTGSLNRGIYLFNTDSETFLYNFKLANNLVRSIIEDDSGNLWIGTDYGLSRVDPENHIVKNYVTSDNFEGERYSANSAFKTSTGEMLFGTYDGFILFHPDSIKDDPVPPQVVISSVSLFNRPGDKLKYEGYISDLKELNLSYNQNDLRFDYVGLHYGDPLRNKYQYMLEGHEENWVEAGTQRNATYTNLDPGEYVFRVKASNLDDVWNEEGASLRIIISPPFWATWWAYSLYIIFVCLILYGARRYEMNRVNLKNQIKLDEVMLKEREETDRMKSRFFANISHEFRTPLTLILGPAENIAPDSPPEEVQRQTGLIKRNAQRLMILINQLLDLSKLEAGGLKLRASKNNIVSFVKGIVMSFESLAERKDITLRINSDKDDIELYFDRDMMIKILTNLLSNAIKFTPEGGAITVCINCENTEPALPAGRQVSASSKDVTEISIPIKSGRNENMITITVKDTGIGIPEEEVPKLFDRFYQVASSQTREYEGSGLGLALTKELVEVHKGNIYVKSKINEGSEFIVEFPSGRDHLSQDQIVEAEISENEKHFLDESVYRKKSELIFDDIRKDLRENKNLILLVEDNKDVREYIKYTLCAQYRVEEAANGQQGLNKAKEIVPDLIISDIMMPGMDGIEFCRIIKTEFLTSHIPVILLTAKASHDNKIEGLETGADDYLIKPFDSKELLVRIKNLIEIRRLLKEKFAKDVNPKPAADTFSTIDKEFLNSIYNSIDNHLSDIDYNTEILSSELFMSRMKLHRKLQAITGQTPGDFIRTYRLKRAAEMLNEKKLSVTQIAYEVGYNSPSHFSKAFIKYFNCNPSEYAK